MTELLKNYLNGQWTEGRGRSTPLLDPVTGAELVRVSSEGLDLMTGFSHARVKGGGALRELTYSQRAALLGEVAKVLQKHRDAYFEISTANSGTVKNDSAVDIDGAIFTLGQYAKWGASMGDAKAMRDGTPVKLSKEGAFQSQHVLVPTRGVALFINAFNFPSWGLWEKAAPALLSGVPVIVKPATATAWLTHRMVSDVIAANVLPEGALSIVCGSSSGLLDALQPFDVLSFTGSAETAALIRSHQAVAARSVRVNIEADSLNSALLLPGSQPSDAAFNLLVREAVREMTVKSGQKCTAIRRILVPQDLYAATAEAIGAKLTKVTVGNPRNDNVRMGSLVSREQRDNVINGLAALKGQTELLHDGAACTLIDADASVAACLGPMLLGARDADSAPLVHDLEVFGPVATLVAYRDLAHAHALVQRGSGSLVTSLYGHDDTALAQSGLELAACHGRVHVITQAVESQQTGHGNVMPHSLHGGPGRAGGGEELGGLRALNFYHRRTAIQADVNVLSHLSNQTAAI